MAVLIRNIQDVVRHNLCVSCGACASVVEDGAIEMRYSEKFGMDIPVILKPNLVSGSGIEFDVCPGKGLDILRLSKIVSSSDTKYNILIGNYHRFWATHSKNPFILENASSGGIMTEIASYLISSGRVKGVVATKLVYGPNGPWPSTIIAESYEELLECQGSKYLPVSANLALKTLRKYSGRVAFIGTPCQIAGIRMAQERDSRLKDQIPFTIGNFCGGFRDIRDLHAHIHRAGFSLEEISLFRHRGGGQPGSMKICNLEGKAVERPYPVYVRDTGYQKINRCLLCIDGTAELADFACGDAWIRRYLEHKDPWSILMTRNEMATSIIEEMFQKGLIELSDVSIEEVIESQRNNLKSKKKRQAARRKIYNMLGKPIPIYDGGFPEASSNLWRELYIYFIHRLNFLLQTWGLYNIFRPLLERIGRV